LVEENFTLREYIRAVLTRNWQNFGVQEPSTKGSTQSLQTTDRYPLQCGMRAAYPTTVRFIGSFKINEARISTRIERPQNYAAPYNTTDDKNSQTTQQREQSNQSTIVLPRCRQLISTSSRSIGPHRRPEI
jgi:hypothetical protein